MSQQMDIITLVKYGVGALMVIAGVALLMMTTYATQGVALIAAGLALLGYQVGERQGIKLGAKMMATSPT